MPNFFSYTDPFGRAAIKNSTPLGGASVPSDPWLLSASLENSLPDEFTFTRIAGPYSYQSAAALVNTTFLISGSAANTARYNWVTGSSRPYLLIEPMRTNLINFSNWEDTDVNHVPDNWLSWAGIPGSNWHTDLSGSPGGGVKVRQEANALAAYGPYKTTVVAATTDTHTFSAWRRVTGLSTANALYGVQLAGWTTLVIPAGTHEWQRVSGTQDGLASGASKLVLIAPTGVPDGTIEHAHPQCETGSYASSWIPTSGGVGVRQAERCIIAASVVPVTSGTVAFSYIPGFDSVSSFGNPQIFCWNATSYIDVITDSGKKFRVVNAGGGVATSAATTWNAGDILNIKVGFGPYGTDITINGAATYDATPWVVPVLSNPALGSDSAGTSIASACYGDIVLTGT